MSTGGKRNGNGSHEFQIYPKGILKGGKAAFVYEQYHKQTKRGSCAFTFCV